MCCYYMKQNETKKSQKVADFFLCKNCEYITERENDYNKHLLTRKHKMKQNETKKSQKLAENYSCNNCGYICNSRTSLWRHKKNCNTEITNVSSNIDIGCDNSNDTTPEMSDKEIIRILLEQNEKLFKMVENSPSSNIVTNNINNVSNVGNKTFNLNVFLNDTCKDALNINDFVSSIKINFEDLENTGRQGYIQGISNIFLKNLNKLEQHMRPLHCSDFKREVMYIKYNNEWTKETDNKPILTNAIKTIANENIKQISKWRDNYPDCVSSDSIKNDLYLKIVSNSMNGLTKEEGDKNINKIISNVSKK